MQAAPAEATPPRYHLCPLAALGAIASPSLSLYLLLVELLAAALSQLPLMHCRQPFKFYSAQEAGDDHYQPN